MFQPSSEPEATRPAYDYSQYRFLLIFVLTYSSGEPTGILTSEMMSSLALDINKDFLWRFDYDESVEKIKKLVFVDAARMPPTKLGNLCSESKGNTISIWINVE
jgi:hypothetical protein